KHLKYSGIKEIVYVAPRHGFAAISLSWLCKKYDLKLILVMPSSKEVSDHQALCIELGATPLFIRIASMPNANRAARLYAEADLNTRYFIPLGMKHFLVTAMAVRGFHEYFKNIPHPKNMWTVISTGVLTRSLQIALPNTNFHAVAVSRNIKKGELGRAKFYSYHKLFTSKSDLIPSDFDCDNTYDSKAWDYMNRYGEPGDWFFSVAGNSKLPTINKSSIDSYRDWRDYRDFTNLGITI